MAFNLFKQEQYSEAYKVLKEEVENGDLTQARWLAAICDADLDNRGHDDYETAYYIIAWHMLVAMVMLKVLWSRLALQKTSQTKI